MRPFLNEKETHGFSKIKIHHKRRCFICMTVNQLFPNDFNDFEIVWRDF